MEAITATIYMKPETEGGRHSGFRVDYCPHIVAEGTDVWLPVRVIDIEGLQEVPLGATSAVTFQLLHNTLDYSALATGHKFIIREGPKEVGEGTVIDIIADKLSWESL